MISKGDPKSIEESILPLVKNLAHLHRSLSNKNRMWGGVISLIKVEFTRVFPIIGGKIGQKTVVTVLFTSYINWRTNMRMTTREGFRYVCTMDTETASS